jgi:hypothetical protein
MFVVRSSLLVLCVLLPSAAAAQDPDLQVDPAQPDFTLSAMPTTLRMPSGKFAFRITHRFSRPIAAGSAGDFFADLFGFDSSARIGLELRYGLRPGTEVTFHRTNDRAIQFLGQHEFVRQAGGRPLTAHLLLAAEGENNFSQEFSGTIGAVVSRQFTARGAIYVQPLFVSATNPASGGDRHTVLVGVGARVRLGQSRTYLVAEAAPQVAGYDGGIDHISIGIEKRAGGHMFQLTVSNALGTTMRQVARGGPHEDDWFIGFNLSRRFY